MFDFDEVIDRRGTHCSKWDGMAGRFPGVTEDTIPMWVADMDFRGPPAAQQALRDMAEHGVHGYYGDDSGMRAAAAAWMDTRHGWRPEPGWISFVHGLVAGIGFSVQAFTEPGEAVVVFSPVYHMFGNTVRAAGRDLFEAELSNVQGRYQMDLETLGRDLPANARMVLLCSPHNPGGRVWTAGELRALATFCAERDLILVSDEIHCDLVFDGATHVPTQVAAPGIADRLVTLMAPTKTFNLAATLTGCAVIPDADLRRRFNAAKAACGSGAVNCLGMVVAEAAYREGAPWLDALLPYLQANRDHLAATVAAEIPGVRPMHLESTYLAWLDFSGLDMTAEEATRRVFEDARIAVNKGPTFGRGGEAFLRFNFACPRATLDRAMERLVAAFRG